MEGISTALKFCTLCCRNTKESEEGSDSKDPINKNKKKRETGNSG